MQKNNLIADLRFSFFFSSPHKYQIITHLIDQGLSLVFPKWAVFFFFSENTWHNNFLLQTTKKLDVSVEDILPLFIDHHVILN